MHQQNINNRTQTIINNIAKEFSIDKISKSPARFNLEKFNWFNREFIKILTLEEFAYRACDNKLVDYGETKNYRVGDYVYFVDFETHQVFGAIGKDLRSSEANFHPIGGGRELESPIENLTKEIAEELPQLKNFDPNKLLPLCEIFFPLPEYTKNNEIFQGKYMNYFVYPISQSELVAAPMADETDIPLDWTDLVEVITTGSKITYPIWENFCAENSLPCFVQTKAIKQQYLGWNLDKNRVTVLSELGAESDCVLNYVRPEPELLKWKKITLEESLQNLKNVSAKVELIYDELSQEQAKLYSSHTNDLPIEYAKLAALWEEKLKAWIVENGLDTGAHFWPLRVALSGKVKSPSPFELLAILTKEQAMARLSV